MYQGTYEGILRTIVKGRLIHADETQVSIEGKRAYVWVFTTLEEVIYYYTETREGDFLHELLREFRGVLVSDFYAAYDALREAMSWYEKAAALRPPENDDATLRWNACARTIMDHRLAARAEDDFRPLLE